jgi:anti-sigma-K factor RskA
MLIPFIIMFGALLITPLQIAGTAQPLVASGYILENINLAEDQVKSTTLLTGSAIQNIVSKYLSYLSPFNGFALSQINQPLLSSAVSLNSAFLFNSQITNASHQYQTVSQQSMWFSRGLVDQADLSPTLRNIYNRYLQTEPYLRALVQSPINTTLASITVLFAAAN